MTPRFVSYTRVSTQQQGRSGLGLEAQRQAVADYVARAGGQLVAEFREVESGRRADRPQLAAALAACRTRRAVLVIAKLDRLARNARFLLSVVEGCGPGGVVFADLPTLPAGPMGKFFLTQMAAIAELEAGMIGERTRDALAAAKLRGVKLGGFRAGARIDPAAGRAVASANADRFAAEVGPIARDLLASGLSLRAVAHELTAQGIPTARGKQQWGGNAVRNLLARSPCPAPRQDRAAFP